MSTLTRTPIEKRGRTIKKRPLRAAADPRNIGVKISQLPPLTNLTGATEVTTLAGGINYRSPISAIPSAFAGTRAAMAAVNPALQTVVTLTEPGREGLFRWDARDLSAHVTADATQGIYVAPAASTGLATNGSAGAWVRQHDGKINIRWFGALGIDLLIGGNGLAFPTQTVTVTAQPYVLSFFNTGTITLSGAYTGTLVGTGASAQVSRVFTPTAGSLTLTPSGTVYKALLEPGSTLRVPSDEAAWTSFNNLIPLMPVRPSNSLGATQAAASVQLLVPPSEGIYRVDASQIVKPPAGKAVQAVIVDADGARIESTAIYQDYIGFTFDPHPLIATALAGAASVTLLTPAEASQFAVGRIACVMCLALQTGGYPPNSYFFEYKRITAINPATGEITFDKPLIYNYLSTYPFYPEPHIPGPACVRQMSLEWDTALIFRGGTNTNEEQIYTTAREQTWIDWTSTGKPLVPHSGERNTFIRYTAPTTDAEVDKQISQLDFIDCRMNAINVQSTSTDRMTIRGGNINYLVGSPKNLRLENTVLNHFTIGAWGYGYTTSIQAYDSYVGPPDLAGTSTRVMYPSYFLPYTGNGILQMDISAASGGITSEKHAAIATLVPGARFYLTGSDRYYNGGCPFTILDITRSGDILTVKTSLPNTIPTTSFYEPFGNFSLHPCEFMSARGCSGNQLWRSLSLSTIEPRPFGCYFNTGPVIGPPPTDSYFLQIMWGRLLRLRINVLRPYTGTPALNLHALGIYGTQKLAGPFSGGDGVAPGANYNPTVNLKIAGMRELLPPAAATGLQTGDVIPTLADSWFMSNVSAALSASIVGESSEKWPVWQVEMITEQRV